MTPTAGYFHYDVDPSALYSEGVIRVTVTGKVRDSSRSIQLLVSRGGSTEFLYYTDFEDADPGNTQVYPSGPSSDDCGKVGAVEGQVLLAEVRSGCVEIQLRHRRHARRCRALQRHPVHERIARLPQGLRDVRSGLPDTQRRATARGDRRLTQPQRCTHRAMHRCSTCRTTATRSPPTRAASTPGAPASSSTTTER